MPFTPAHPAIVLPFIKNKRLSATALIIGSTSPDFEYFFKASVSGAHGHTLFGLFYFDLPVTILLSLVFHQIIKQNLYSNMPTIFQRKFSDVYKLNFLELLKENWSSIIISTLIGAGSHIFWDSFTHNGTYFVENFEIYKNITVPYDGVDYPLFYALQHTSTFIGLSIVLIYIIRMPIKEIEMAYKPRLSYWLAVIILSLIFFIARFAFISGHFEVGNQVVTAISASILSLSILGLVPYLRGNLSTS